MSSSSLPLSASVMLVFLLSLAIAAAHFSLSVSASADPPAFPWLDPSLPISDRVSSLIGNLTLDEKIALLQNTNPPIVRLGLPGYDWWSEASHGQHSSQR
jgi:beta-glucosidase